MIKGPTSLELQLLIKELKHLASKKNSKLWKRIVYELSKSRRRKTIVNLDKINLYTKEKEIALIPGKVLSSGQITKNIKVSAYQFSQQALTKLGNKAILLKDLIKEDPKNKHIRIIK